MHMSYFVLTIFLYDIYNKSTAAKQVSFNYEFNVSKAVW